ncbi:GW dipeptide domain-containing protein [Levilactobacillus hammesii]|uniref:GW domain-containing protein n=1 Tax=Levilactobacillus hammesii DSM 16381 TaxID=1423753 RepID=A0A0R1UT22_9LACO|nr:hypothetical protein [Levilactobacillus hammesii]KRL94101.1 hypothetical protein FD28_GL000649 [Levilactobacillus hammesii DSM 16381]
MNKIFKELAVTGLALTSFIGLTTVQPTTANASKVHYIKWNKPMKHHQVAVNGRKSAWKGYTLKKVSNKHYRFRTAAKLSSTKYQVSFLTTLRHAKIDHSIYYQVRIGKKGQAIWVNRHYLTGWYKNTTTTQKVTKKSSQSKATAKKTAKTSATTKAKAKNASKKTNTKTDGMYVNATKHITWSQWLNLPAFGAEGNGIPLYNVDNVPYDEDGLPYVSNKMGSASPIEVTQLKSEFTAAAYAAIPDKANTYYLSDKNALYHPTNPEVGQAIRDKIPSDTNFDNARDWSETKKVADLSSNFFIADLTVGETQKVQMWSGTVGGLKLSDLQMNSYTITSANPAVVTAPSKTTTGTFMITATGAGKSSVTVRSVNNPKLSLRIDVNVN